MKETIYGVLAGIVGVIGGWITGTLNRSSQRDVTAMNRWDQLAARVEREMELLEKANNENTKLSADNQDLKSDNDELKKDNAELKQKVDNLQKTVDRQSVIIDQLNDNINDLKQTVEHNQEE